MIFPLINVNYSDINGYPLQVTQKGTSQWLVYCNSESIWICTGKETKVNEIKTFSLSNLKEYVTEVLYDRTA